MLARAGSERGSVLIYVAAALFALGAFSAFVFDYGLLWVSRRQAQNSADAGAHAGAVALAFDSYTDRSDAGPAKTSALAAAQDNYVWGQAPSVTDADITFPPCPDDGSDGCIRVDVYRDATHGSALPTFFGPLAGITSQNIRATAIAKAGIANANNCLKPWAVPDKWLENSDGMGNADGPWDPTKSFNLYYSSGPNKGNPLPNADVYVAPTPSDPGTGFNVNTDLGLQLTLKTGTPNDAIAPGWFFPVDLPRADGEPDVGGSRYRDNIASCSGVTIKIGDTLKTEEGNMVGPTAQGMKALIGQDPTATWNSTTKTIENSCATFDPPCAQVSPRVVPIPIFDTYTYASQQHLSGKGTVTVVNILGFFLDHMVGNDVVGYLTTYPGLTTGTTSSLTSASSFSKTILLVR